jgi:hypothetical protein
MVMVLRPQFRAPRWAAWLALAALGAVAAMRPAAARPDRKADEERDGGAVIDSLGPGARVDWTRGLLIATGAAAGDLRAPSAELARLKAERQARDAARTQLRRHARDLALADGRELGAALEGKAAARFDRALESLLDEHVEHASDGSVVLTAALPLESVRAAVFGPAPPASAGQDGPTAIVVDAGRHLDRPALGVKLAAGSERYAGPTVFAARGDAIGPERLGSRPVQVEAVDYRGGALHLADDDAAALVSARAAGALVVVELKPGRRDKRGRGEKRKGQRDRSKANKEKR